MKKIAILLYLLLLFPLSVFATNYNTPVGNDIGYNGCLNFQDSRVNASADGYFGHCKKATCYTGEWKNEYYISSDMITCTNGNNNYYIQTINDGCSQYKGSCTPTTQVKYCSMVVYYDCTKTKSGEVYVEPKPVLDSNNYLKDLTVSPGSINFNRNTLNYEITLEQSVKEVKVGALAESSKATVTILNAEKIDESIPIRVVVKAENGATRTYTISVKYKASQVTPPTNPTNPTNPTSPTSKLDSNNYLKSLTVSPGSINFNRNTLNYEIEVDDDVKNITVNATADSSKSKVTITNNQNIKEDTPIKIVVRAENGRTRTYKINIKFKEKTTTTEPVTEPSDSNNYLKSLTLSETNLFFKKDILVYNIELDNGVKSLEVSAIAESDKSKVTIENNKELKENVPIKITVTAENGSTRVYTINIKYKAAAPTLSSNNLLKEITIKNYDLKFNSSINDYVLKVDKETEKLDIEVVAEDEKSSYVITGNNKLKNKSKIVILVTAEDGTENVYTITIKKDTNNILLQLLIIVIIIVIIIFGIKILRKILPGKKDKNYDYE